MSEDDIMGQQDFDQLPVGSTAVTAPTFTVGNGNLSFQPSENITGGLNQTGISSIMQSSPPPHSYRHSRAYRHFKNPPQPHMSLSCLGSILGKRQNNNDEIKSEQIKSEKETDGNSSKEVNCSDDKLKENRKMQHSLHVLKCAKCPFITLSTDYMKKHEAHETHVRQNKLLCFGCDNIFYAQSSLSAHLLIDHFMDTEEVATILRSEPFYTEDKKKTAQNLQYNNNASIGKNSAMQQKSRIYLKNVECLREPRQENHTSDSFNCTGGNRSDIVKNCHNANIQDFGLQKQKISIKCVDVLREPTFLDSTHQEQGTFDFQNSNNSKENSLIQHDCTLHSVSDFCDSPRTISQENCILDKPSGPKIYIKNVDILKEPIFLPPNNLSNFLNVEDDLNFNIFNSVTPLDDINCSATTASPLPTIQFLQPVENSNGENFLDSNTFGEKPTDMVSKLKNTAASFHTEEAVSPKISYQQSQNNAENHQKSKIYIKNVDILKQPQFQETRKAANLLHLRTVDELNLMNKNEVENLIAPNLDGGVPISNASSIHPFENRKTTTDLFNSSNDRSANHFQLPNINENSWTADLDELDCIIDSSSFPIDQKKESYSNRCLNTPHLVSPSLPDLDKEKPYNSAFSIAVDDDDPEILFVCAEELINATKQKESEPRAFSDHEGNSAMEIGNILDNLKKQQSHPISIPDILEKSSVVRPSSLTENICETNSPRQQSNSPSAQKIASKKGRIYVSVNLMHENKSTSSICNKNKNSIENNKSNNSSTSRGRSFKHTGSNKTLKMLGSALTLKKRLKCNLNGCGSRFEKSETLDYHKKCHNGSDSHQPIICPECKLTEFSCWNTLHTHIWRCHEIDMELYSCGLCNFKTPIYSRLVNTHSKIHSDERNFKCEQCDKAFKNTKQLKNHRRWHRSAGQNTEVHICSSCGSVFSHLKSLRYHICKESEELRCSICSRYSSSASSLKLHMLTHEAASKFKCKACDYVSNDHNAFRRHKMKHENSKTYSCPFCDYRSIQSFSFQKHIKSKHPSSANEVVHMCSHCSFSTINRNVFAFHTAKHRAKDHLESKNSTSDLSSKNTISVDDFASKSRHKLVGVQTEKNSNSNIENYLKEKMKIPSKNMIKVKSDLVLTDPTKFSNNSNNYFELC